MYIRFLKVQPVNEWTHKRRTMRRYDLTAGIYDARYAEEQAIKYQAALEHLKLAPHSMVLDVGCGTGLFLGNVAAKTEAVVGVDISRLLLRQAKKRVRDLRNVYLVQADADHLPFRNACFSLVFAFTVLQNMPKPLETLNEVKRNAKHEASIVVTGLKKTFSLEGFSALLKNAGLQLVHFQDADELKCYVVVTLRN